MDIGKEEIRLNWNNLEQSLYRLSGLNGLLCYDHAVIICSRKSMEVMSLTGILSQETINLSILPTRKIDRARSKSYISRAGKPDVF